MTVLNVGVGQQYTTIAAAVAASRDGDTIRVQAGTYTNDFATINTRVTIESVGGMAKVVATRSAPDGKAIFTTNADVTFRGLEITGAAARDNNGAAIRYQAGNLAVEGCYIHDNQDGILAASNPTGTILITGSEFSHNGAGDGKSHNIYVNKVARLTIRDSYFHDAVVGHEIKSRAANTVIENNRIFSNATGTGSYNIDLPNGGVATVRGNTIEKGPLAQNTAMIHFGGESAPYAGSSLEVSGNTLVADRAGAIGVLNHTDLTVTGGANATYGLTGTNLAVGAASLSATTVLPRRPALDTSSMGPAIAAPTTTAPATAVVDSPVATSVYTAYGREGAVVASGRVLTVGKGKQFATLAQAVAGSRDGDVIKVDAGTYANDFAEIRTKVIIEGVGGMARFVASGTSAYDKAILITGTDVTIRNVELTGATSTAGNGAGIRYQGGNLTLVNSYVHGNQTGLLGAPSAGGTIGIYDSEFGDNFAPGRVNHNINVNRIGSLTVEDSYLHGGKDGHQLRTLSENTVVRGSRIIDGDGASVSFGIDLARGGNAVIEGNTIVKGQNSLNGVQLHIGGEGATYSNSRYVIAGNSFVSNYVNRWHPSTYNVANATDAVASVQGNTFNARVGKQVSGPAQVSGSATVSTAPAPDTSAPWSAAAADAYSALRPALGTDTLVLRLSGRAGKTDAQFVVRVDGEAIGGGTVTADRTAGASQTFAFTGRWGMGEHTVTVEAVNLRAGVPAATDLMVQGISFGGNEYAPNRLLNAWRQSDGFAVSKTVEPPASKVAEPPAPVAVSASATPVRHAMTALALAEPAASAAPAAAVLSETAGASGVSAAQAATAPDAAAPVAVSTGALDSARAPAFLAGLHADDAGADAVRLYRAALGRLPDADGLGFWTNRLQDGASLADLAQGFLSSPEFQARFGAPDDAGYVAQLYQNVLGRQGEAGGVAYWTDTLAHGASRQAVLAGFSESAENKQGTQSLFLPGV